MDANIFSLNHDTTNGAFDRTQCATLEYLKHVDSRMNGNLQDHSIHITPEAIINCMVLRLGDLTC